MNGSRVTGVVGFLPANFQPSIFLSTYGQARDRQTVRQTNNGHQCITPTLWRGA